MMRCPQNVIRSLKMYSLLSWLSRAAKTRRTFLSMIKCTLFFPFTYQHLKILSIPSIIWGFHEMTHICSLELDPHLCGHSFIHSFIHSPRTRPAYLTCHVRVRCVYVVQISIYLAIVSNRPSIRK